MLPLRVLLPVVSAADDQVHRRQDLERGDGVGNALKFYATVRLDIRRTGQVKDGETAMGSKTRVKVVKNKVAPPFRECEFEILYGTGVNWAGEIVDLGVAANLIDRSGAHYSWNGERIAQGRDRACAFMLEHAEVAEQIRLKLVELGKAERSRAAGSSTGEARAEPAAA